MGELSSPYVELSLVAIHLQESKQNGSYLHVHVGEKPRNVFEERNPEMSGENQKCE